MLDWNPPPGLWLNFSVCLESTPLENKSSHSQGLSPDNATFPQSSLRLTKTSPPNTNKQTNNRLKPNKPTQHDSPSAAVLWGEFQPCPFCLSREHVHMETQWSVRNNALYIQFPSEPQERSETSEQGASQIQRCVSYSALNDFILMITIFCCVLVILLSAEFQRASCDIRCKRRRKRRGVVVYLSSDSQALAQSSFRAVLPLQLLIQNSFMISFFFHFVWPLFQSQSYVSPPHPTSSFLVAFVCKASWLGSFLCCVRVT